MESICGRGGVGWFFAGVEGETQPVQWKMLIFKRARARKCSKLGDVAAMLY